MASLGFGCVWVARRGPLLLLSRGFSLSLAHPRTRMRFGVLYSGTLSARDVGVPSPAGSLTARVLGKGGSVSRGSAAVFLLFSSFVSRHLGLRV